jgi:hypothetical protein
MKPFFLSLPGEYYERRVPMKNDELSETPTREKRNLAEKVERIVIFLKLGIKEIFISCLEILAA